MYRKLSAPISVQVEMTSSCNNNCVYCYNYWREDSDASSNTLSPKSLGLICEQLIRHRVFATTFTGGEPLLVWKQLSEATSLLRNKGVDVSLNSNLTLLNRNIAYRLRNDGLSSIMTSLLSDREDMHDQLCSRKGSWKETVHGIGIALSAGFDVGVNMVLLKKNQNHIYDLAKFLKSLGVKSFSVTKASPALNPRNFDEFRVSIEEVRKSLNTLELVKQDLAMNTDIMECYPMCLISDIRRFGYYARRNCTAGVTSCTIGSDGNVRPCSHADMIYGSIFKEELSSIFQKMDDWQEGKYIPEECGHCEYLKMCSGGCRMEAKYQGDICGKDPFMTCSEDVVIDYNMRFCPDAILADRRYQAMANIRWRKESFGGIVYSSISGPILVDDDGMAMLRALSSESFTLEEAVQKMGGSKERLERFFSILLNANLIAPCAE